MANAPSQMVLPLPSPSTPKTLLIVDDCAEDRATYRRFLARDPEQTYEILEADLAVEGLALCKEMHCDLILLDLGLPDMTGLEFLEQQQRQPKRSPVIMLTGQGSEELAVQALQKGAHHYLVKHHLQADTLYLAVRQALQSRDASVLPPEPLKPQTPEAVALGFYPIMEPLVLAKKATAAIATFLGCDRVVLQRRESATLNVPIATAYGTNAPPLPPQTPPKRRGRHTRHAAPIVPPAQRPWDRPGRVNPDCVQIVPLPLLQMGAATPLALPLQADTADNNWGWLLIADRPAAHPWDSDSLRTLEQLSHHLAIALSQAEAWQSHHHTTPFGQPSPLSTLHLISTVIHHCREALARILAAAPTLQQQALRLTPEQQQRYLSIISDGARAIAKRLDNLAVVQLLEAGPQALQPVLMNLPELIQQQIQTQLTPEDIPLLLRVSSSETNFWGDRRIIQSLVQSLLNHGLAMADPPGSLQMQLHIAPHQPSPEHPNPTQPSQSSTQAQLRLSYQSTSQLIGDWLRPSQGATRPLPLRSAPMLELQLVQAWCHLHAGQMTFDRQGSTITIQVSLQSPPTPIT